MIKQTPANQPANCKNANIKNMSIFSIWLHEQAYGFILIKQRLYEKKAISTVTSNNEH
jgi:hypothetical protein